MRLAVGLDADEGRGSAQQRDDVDEHVEAQRGAVADRGAGEPAWPKGGEGLGPRLGGGQEMP